MKRENNINKTNHSKKKAEHRSRGTTSRDFIDACGGGKSNASKIIL